nr:hypothetical protein [Tanacetum cinerariifolium]
MHNSIMAAGSKDRPLMLAPGRYAQWQSRFLRYINTRLNGDALRKCILEGPYQLTTVIIPAVHAIDDSPAAPKSYKSYAPPSKQSSSTRKPKRVKDYTYHKKKMLCKQAEKGVPLQVEQADWLANMDKEIDEQKLEAQYSYMAKIQEVSTTDLGNDTEPLEKVQYDAEYNVFANKRQHSKQPESISNTCVVEKVDSNVILDSSN